MEHLVFVYGTLKEGFPNFHVNHGRRIGGDFVTTTPHRLLVIGEAGLPWLLPQDGHAQARPVTGQLYAVDDAGLARMDVLEQIDEAGWYLRRRIAVQPAEGGAALEAWVYFGDPARVALEPLRHGPLAVYTPEHARCYREGH